MAIICAILGLGIWLIGQQPQPQQQQQIRSEDQAFVNFQCIQH